MTLFGLIYMVVCKLQQADLWRGVFAGKVLTELPPDTTGYRSRNAASLRWPQLSVNAFGNMANRLGMSQLLRHLQRDFPWDLLGLWFHGYLSAVCLFNHRRLSRWTTGLDRDWSRFFWLSIRHHGYWAVTVKCGSAAWNVLSPPEHCCLGWARGRTFGL